MKNNPKKLKIMNLKLLY